VLKLVESKEARDKEEKVDFECKNRLSAIKVNWLIFIEGG
jgi:hypothetical protein